MAKAIVDKDNQLIIPEVTVDDFVARYGTMESLEISQLHDPNALTIDRDRIDLAIYDAQCWLRSTLLVCNALGRELITAGAKRYICAGARFLLDTLRRREVVKEEWTEVNETIARFATESNRISKWQASSRASGGGGLIRMGNQRQAQYTQCQMAQWRQLGNNGNYINFPDHVVANWSSANQSNLNRSIADDECTTTLPGNPN